MDRVASWIALFMVVTVIALLVAAPSVNTAVAALPAEIESPVTAAQETVFGPIINLSNSPRASQFPAIAADNHHNVYVAWSESRFDEAAQFERTQILFSRLSPGPAGMIQSPISSVADDLMFDPGYAFAPQLMADRTANRLHISWGRDAVYYTNRYPAATGNWIRTIFVGSHGSYPSMAIEENGLATGEAGAVHLVYQTIYPSRGHVEHAAYRPNGTTVREPVLMDGIIVSPGESRTPSISLDWFGQAHAVWSDTTLAEHGETSAIYYSYRTPLLHWTPANIHNISQWAGGVAMQPKIIADGTGRLHVVYMRTIVGQAYPEIIYQTRPHDADPTGSRAGFGDPVILSNLPGRSLDPDIAVSPDNRPYVVWAERDGPNLSRIYLAFLQPDGVWTPPTLVTTFGGVSVMPRITFDSRGYIHIVWQADVGGATDILYVNNVPPPPPTPTPTPVPPPPTPTPTPTPVPAPFLSVAPTTLVYIFEPGQTAPQEQNVTIANTGGGQMSWGATHTNVPWLTVFPLSGTASPGVPNIMNVRVDPTLLPGPGTNTAQIVISAPNAANSPQVVDVVVFVGPRAAFFTNRTHFPIVPVRQSQ